MQEWRHWKAYRLAVLVGGCLALFTSASNAQPSPSPGGKGYYIEFRVAEIGTYGHSYVVYGQNGGRKNYADLHPMGGYAVMALGHVLPVPANTAWNPDVLKLRVSSSYRRGLTATEYRKLLAAVTKAKANKSPVWNAIANNCNHFVGELAQAIGLKVPSSFQVSYLFIPALKKLNEGESTPRKRATMRAEPHS